MQTPDIAPQDMSPGNSAPARKSKLEAVRRKLGSAEPCLAGPGAIHCETDLCQCARWATVETNSKNSPARARLLSI